MATQILTKVDPQTLAWPLTAAQALDITMAPGGKLTSHLNLPLTALTSSILLLSTVHETF